MALRPRPWQLPAILLALALAAFGGWWATRTREPLRILLVPMDSEPGDVANLDHFALTVLLADLLESNVGAAVTQVRQAQPPAAYQGFPKAGFILRMGARREGEGLRLRGEWTSLQGYAEGHPPLVLSTADAIPAQAIAAFLQGLPLPRPRGPDLFPRAPEAFWNLVSGLGLGRSRSRREEAMARAEACLRQAPDCPAAHLLTGLLLTQRSILRSPGATEDLAAARDHFEAARRLHPTFTRAASEGMAFLADTGNAGEALAWAARAVKARPHSISTYTGLGYAARYAGHLPALALATDRLEALHLVPGSPWRLQIGLLYLGRREAYAASLRESPGDLRNSLVLFLRGHLALQEGRRDAALASFREAEQDPQGFAHFVRLAGIHRRILEGDAAGARESLATLEKERQGLLSPDGEVTLNLAEAYCLLGDAGRGLDLMERAFAQGFGCTSWYEQNPLLAPARTLPRWLALQAHLRERQAILRTRFP